MAWTREQVKSIFANAAQKYGINVNIALRQINQESGFNPYRVSPKGAKGPAQFMPGTARRFGLSNPFDPVASAEAWGKYMTFLLRRYKGNYALALAGYNAGEGNVDKYKGIPPFAETQKYVASILGGGAIGGGNAVFYPGGSGGGSVFQKASYSFSPEELKTSPKLKGYFVLVIAVLIIGLALKQLNYV